MKKKRSIFLTLIAMIIMTCSLCVAGCGNDAGNELTGSTVSEDKNFKTAQPPAEKEDTDKKDDKSDNKKDNDTSAPDEENKADASENEIITFFPSISGSLCVKGTSIVGENNEVVQLKGLSTHGIAWYPDYVNNNLFGEFRNNWNCNVIRLALYSDEYGGYANGGNQEELRKLIDDGVKYATDNDMYVIIDWHILADGNPNTHKSEAMTFFKDVSSSYADYNNVLYEICNEPNGGTEWETVKEYAEDVIAVIRENDEKAIIIVGTPTWSQEVDKAAADPIEGYDNIMYALHFYADTHKDVLRNRMVSAIDSGLPIFVTEYGICDASGSGAVNISEADKWMEVLDKYNISSCAWNISNKNETSAIFKNSVSKKNGFTEEDLSESGKWIFDMLHRNAEKADSPKKDDNVKNEDDQKDDSKTDDEGKHSNGNLSYTVKMINSWTADDGVHYQYDVSVTNDGPDVTSWEIRLDYSGKINLGEGWNGKYSSDGNTVIISNESYNGSIVSGDTIKDIGFFVIGESGLKVK